MANKQGELRVLKDGIVYGPMGRAELDRLLAAGKISLSHQISVGGAAWIGLDAFLGGSVGRKSAAQMLVAQTSAAQTSATAPQAAPQRVPAPPSTAAPKDDDPVLRLLAGNRVISSLCRAEIEQLRQSGRVKDDDLICALYGPWMRVGDFIAPPRSSPPATFLEEHHDSAAGRAASPPQTTPATVSPVAAATLATSPAMTPPPMVMATLSAASQGVSAPFAPAAVLQPLQFLAANPPDLRADAPLSDEWFVRVRGVLSAPLCKRHVKALFEAREVTRDCPARHATWPENAWRPLHAIPQLADAIA